MTRSNIFIKNLDDQQENKYKGEKVISLAHTACESCKHCLADSFKDCLSPQLLGEKSKSVLSSHIDLYECDLLKVPQELSFDDICTGWCNSVMSARF